MSHRSFRTALSMGALAALSCSVYGPSDLGGSGGSGGVSPGGHGGSGQGGGTTNGGSGGTGAQSFGGTDHGGSGPTTGGGSSGTGPKGGEAGVMGGATGMAGAGGASGDAGDSGSAGASGGSAPTGGKAAGGGGGATGGTGGGSSGGATGGGGTTYPPELIDDMEDGNLYILYNEKRTGNWYTASDTDGSHMGAMVAVTGSPVTGSTEAFHFKGDGSTGWGAQAAFDFIYVGTAKKEPYDASKYKGINFYAKAAAATTVYVRIPIVATTEKATGSTCVPGSTTGKGCEDHYSATVSLTTSWKLVSLDWSGDPPKDVHQEGWGKATWDASTVLGVQFAVKSVAEFWIDDISFNK